MTNNQEQDISFKVLSDNSFSQYFNLEDSGKEFSLSPKDSMEFDVWATGLSTGEEAKTNVLIIVDDEVVQRVSLKSNGWDYLVEKATIYMASGEDISLFVNTESFTIENQSPDIVNVSKGGGQNTGGGGEIGEYDFGSNWSNSSGSLQIRALSNGVATIILRDSKSLMSQKLIVNVGPHPYVNYQNGILTFYYDTERNNRAGETYHINDVDDSNLPAWHIKCGDVTKAIIDPSFADVRPERTY